MCQAEKLGWGSLEQHTHPTGGIGQTSNRKFGQEFTGKGGQPEAQHKDLRQVGAGQRGWQLQFQAEA